jgi:hypothetical protein
LSSSIPNGILTVNSSTCVDIYIYLADFRGVERIKQKMKVLTLRKFDL